MSGQVNPEDVVIVHHNDVGPIAGGRADLARLLERGRTITPEVMLLNRPNKAKGWAPVPMVLVDQVGNQIALHGGSMLWLSPNVAHISPAAPDFARAVVRAIDEFHAKQSGVELVTPQSLTPSLLESLR